MQDETSQASVALMIHSGKVTAEVLARAMQRFLARSHNLMEKTAQKTATITHRGKQSLQSLKDDGAQLSTIPISAENIGSFEAAAKKYEVDYSLKKDTSAEEPTYLVIFKAKDVDLMEAAFREYSSEILEPGKKKERPSLRMRLREKQEKVREREPKVREKVKVREEVR